MRRGAILALALASIAADAAAQERYQLERGEGGVIRLDRQTGAMTLCREENGSLSCRMAPDERAAYEKELDLLEKRVEALEARIGAAPARPLPSEDEIDRSLSIMERVMRRFMAIINEFTGDESNKEAQPDRT